MERERYGPHESRSFGPQGNPNPNYVINPNPNPNPTWIPKALGEIQEQMVARLASEFDIDLHVARGMLQLYEYDTESLTQDYANDRDKVFNCLGIDPELSNPNPNPNPNPNSNPDPNPPRSLTASG